MKFIPVVHKTGEFSSIFIPANWSFIGSSSELSARLKSMSKGFPWTSLENVKVRPSKLSIREFKGFKFCRPLDKSSWISKSRGIGSLVHCSASMILLFNYYINLFQAPKWNALKKETHRLLILFFNSWPIRPEKSSPISIKMLSQVSKVRISFAFSCTIWSLSLIIFPKVCWILSHMYFRFFKRLSLTSM